jgi:hypothetical protein
VTLRLPDPASGINVALTLPEVGASPTGSTGLRASVSNQDRWTISRQRDVSKQDFQNILSQATDDEADTPPIAGGSEFTRLEPTQEQCPVPVTADAPEATMRAAKSPFAPILSPEVNINSDKSGDEGLNWPIFKRSSNLGGQHAESLISNSNKTVKPRMAPAVDISSSSKNAFAAITAMVQPSEEITQANKDPEVLPSTRFAEPILDISHNDNQARHAVTALVQQAGRVGNVVAFKDREPESNSDLDVEAFSLTLRPRYNLPGSATSSINSIPGITNSLALSQKTQVPPSSAESLNTLDLLSGLNSTSSEDPQTSHVFTGTNVARVIEKEAPNEPGPQLAISSDRVPDQSSGPNLVQAIEVPSRTDNSRVEADTAENASRPERSLPSDNQFAPAPGETRALAIEPATQLPLLFGYTPTRESGIAVTPRMTTRASLISESRPASRSRNMPSVFTSYRSLASDSADEEASESQSNNSHVDGRLATLSGPLTNDVTGEGQSEMVATSGLAQNSSQQLPSTPDLLNTTSPQGEAFSRTSAISESLIPARQSSQPQHENSNNQPTSVQPLFPSPVDGGISSNNTTQSSSETQSPNRNLPIDLTETAKLPHPAVGGVKEISIRVEASSGEIVHLKVVDQVSQVQVGVRSTNASLATNLRQDLSSLTATLDRLGWKSDLAAGPTLIRTATTSDAGQGANDQSDPRSQTAADWWNNPEHNRRSPSELWDEALNS